MNLIFTKRAPLAFAAFFAAAAIAACNDDSTGTSATPAAVAASTSPPASATAGVAIAGPAVLVTDAAGAPVKGAVVNFAVTAGGGSVQYPVVITGDDGIASSGAWQIGAPGTNTMTATVETLPAVTFTTTASLGAGSQITRRGGDNQIGSLNTPLPIPLTIKLANAGGIGIPNQPVTFTVTGGGGSIAGSPTVTDANGFATSGAWTLGPNFGTNTVVAQSGSLSTTFTAVVDPCEDRTPLAVDQTVNGTLAFGAARCAIAGAATDRYALTTPSGAVNITLSSSAFDALLNVSNAAGNVLVATNNDAGGGTTNSALRLITAAQTKTVDATSATAAQTGAYTVAVASTSADVTTCGTTFIEIGASTAQNLTATDCGDPNNYDEYKVYIPAGTTVRIDLTHGGTLDGYLILIPPGGGAAVACADDNQPGGQERITFAATTAGVYTIRSSAWGLKAPGACDQTGFRYGAEFAPYNLSIVIP